MTIKSLEVSNFERYKSAYLEFHKGLNVVTGLSGHGKSSLIRCLRFVLTNEPTGSGMIPKHFSSSETSATIELEEGEIVSRIKGKDFNGYVLVDQDDNETKFEVLKMKVPEKIKDVLEIEYEANIQKQGDFYFMLLDTPGARAKAFNKLTGLEKIDSALKEVNFRNNHHKSNRDTLASRRDDLNKEIDETSWILDAHEGFLEIEKVSTAIKVLDQRWEQILEVLKSIDNVDWEISKLSMTEAIPKIDRLFYFEEKVNSKFLECHELKNLLKSIADVDLSLKGTAPLDDSQLCKAEESKGQIERLENRIREINHHCDEIDAVDAKIDILDDSIRQLTSDEKRFMKENKVCPTCKGKGLVDK